MLFIINFIARAYYQRCGR